MVQFGVLAVWSGYIRQSTLDFFVKNLTFAAQSNSLKLSHRQQLKYVPSPKKEVKTTLRLRHDFLNQLVPQNQNFEEEINLLLKFSICSMNFLICGLFRQLAYFLD